MNISLPKIKVGDTVRCLNCKEPIRLEDGKTVFVNFEGEYIYCPKCNKYCDIQYYHLYGEKA